MHITVFGIVWILILGCSFFIPIKYLGRMLIITGIFQASSVINIGDKGIYAMIIADAVFIFRSAFSTRFKRGEKYGNWIKLWCVFAVVAILGAIFLPILFKGTLVRTSGMKNLQDMIPLTYTSRNTIQIITLLANSITLIVFYKNKDKFDAKFMLDSFIIAIGIVLFIGFWEYLSKIGLCPIKFPSELIYNNIGYSQAYNQNTSFGIKRMNSTFTEASVCGAFLSASFWACISLKSKKANIMAIILLIALVCNFSGTGVMSMLAGAAIYILLSDNKKRVIPLIIGCLILLIILNAIGMLDQFVEMITGKLTSTSGNIRMSANTYSLELILKTFGLGVGLGSHKSSSLIINLLSVIGIPGTILFLMSMYYLFKPIYKLRTMNSYCNFGIMFFLIMFVAQCLSIPDLTFTPLWMCLYYNCCLNINKISQDVEEKNKKQEEIVYENSNYDLDI